MTATVVEPGTIRFERLLPGPVDRVWPTSPKRTSARAGSRAASSSCASAAGRAWSSTTPASPVTRCRPRSTRTWASPRWDVHTGILEDVLNGVEPRPFWTTHAALEKAYAAAV